MARYAPRCLWPFALAVLLTAGCGQKGPLTLPDAAGADVAPAADSEGSAQDAPTEEDDGDEA